MKKIKFFFKTIFIVVVDYKLNYKLYKQHCKIANQRLFWGSILLAETYKADLHKKRNESLIKQAIASYDPVFGEYLLRKEKMLPLINGEEFHLSPTSAEAFSKAAIGLINIYMPSFTYPYNSSNNNLESIQFKGEEIKIWKKAIKDYLGDPISYAKFQISALR